MESKITATELAKGLSDILNRVRYQGEMFAIERNGEQVAVLTPAIPARGVTLGEAANRLGDILVPGDGFAEDLEAVQASQPQAEMPTWRS